MRYQTAIGTSVATLSIVAVILAASFAYYYATTEDQVSALNSEVSSLNAHNAQLQSQIATKQCIRTGQGYAFYVRVAADGTNKSISGAKVDAIPYTVCASGYTDLGSLVTAVTPSNGTISLPISAIDGYIIIVNYHGSNYTAGEVFAAPVRVTTLTVGIPSGNTSITYSVPFQS